MKVVRENHIRYLISQVQHIREFIKLQYISICPRISRLLSSVSIHPKIFNHAKSIHCITMTEEYSFRLLVSTSGSIFDIIYIYIHGLRYRLLALCH